MTGRPPEGGERPSYEMTIERGKVREFAMATKSDNSAYYDDPNPVIPPTFLTAASFWAPRRRPQAATRDATAGRRAGGARGESQSPAGAEARSMSRVLHGGQEYIFHGPPPRAGTKLTVSSYVADRYEKEGKRGGTMTFTVTVTEYRDESGNLVAEGRSTGIVTSRPPTEGSS